jgi:hypothetical protein
MVLLLLLLMLLAKESPGYNLTYLFPQPHSTSKAEILAASSSPVVPTQLVANAEKRAHESLPTTQSTWGFRVKCIKENKGFRVKCIKENKGFRVKCIKENKGFRVKYIKENKGFGYLEYVVKHWITFHKIVNCS